MRTKKPFTNTNFTKRVDRESGRHRSARGLSEPRVCQECGSIYENRRWTSADTAHQPPTNLPKTQLTVCPACKQKREGEPRGFVSLGGAFLSAHLDEVKQLLRNEEERAREDNPLARILEWKDGKGQKLTVSTTTEHLAQRLGHALEKAFGGKVNYDFSHENKLARVSWKRGR